MQLTIYGSVAAGRLTVNADGLRVVLNKTDAGWVPSSTDGFSALRTSISRELGALIDLLADDPDSPSADPLKIAVPK